MAIVVIMLMIVLVPQCLFNNDAKQMYNCRIGDCNSMKFRIYISD